MKGAPAELLRREGPAMDHAACNVVYVDRTAGEDRVIQKNDVLPAALNEGGSRPEDEKELADSDLQLSQENIKMLLATFSEVHVCTTGNACLSKLAELTARSAIPTIVLIDIPDQDMVTDSLSHKSHDRSPSPTALHASSSVQEDLQLYGSHLLRYIVSDIKHQNISSLVIPVAVMKVQGNGISKEKVSTETESSVRADKLSKPPSAAVAPISIPLEQQRALRCIDLGAIDVLHNPISSERLPSLTIHIYRIYREYMHSKKALTQDIRGRKRSWVGLDDSKPYAYLREAMVSGLMDGICSLASDMQPTAALEMEITSERQAEIVNSLGQWTFAAHDFNDDELLYGARLMLEHALQMPELEQWRIPTESIVSFLAACRSAYNSFVPYHNFRHVIDVLQAVFYFLVQLGTLPPYPPGAKLRRASNSDPNPPIPELLEPFDALTLLITAIGHDVGHPGVNNAFLVTLNAPLAQLYNDRSVLESFHCAAYSQILRRHWPAAFSRVEMRQLMISSILATDMGLHFDYMKKLGWLQEKLHENGGTAGWNGRLIQEYRTLACSLLIKCADISNVARTFDCAAKWTMILTDEFSRQATMEKDLGIPTALFAPPVREIIELGQSQIGFINIFAFPLFQGVTDIMPAMSFSVEELINNKACWEEKVMAEQSRLKALKSAGGERKDSDDSLTHEGTFSPKHLSSTNLTYNVSGSNNGKSNEGTDSSAASGRSKSTTRPSLPSGLRSNSAVSDFDNPTSRQSDERASESRTIPVKGEEVERSKNDISHGNGKESGQLQGTHRHASHGSTEDAWPVCSSGGSGSRPATHSSGPQLGNGALGDVVKRPTAEAAKGERRSETTDGSTSVPSSNDWASQAASSAGKTEGNGSTVKACPSTRGTSVTSSEDRFAPVAQLKSVSTPNLRDQRGRSETEDGQIGVHVMAEDAKMPRESIVATMRSLARKPSRNRFKFWRKKSSVEGAPPLPQLVGDKPGHRASASRG